MRTLEEIQTLKNQVLEDIDLSREVEDEEIRNLIRRHCSTYAKGHMLSLSEREELEY